MSKARKPILDVLQGRVPESVPVWLMRQAGRFLPEYRALREKAGSFLNLCLTPEWAIDVTLQPICRFGMDAAIIFADILLVPMALGLSLDFREGEGPVLQTVKTESDVEKLVFDIGKVSPVFNVLRGVKKELPPSCTLIGFCGAPWTVACYMIDGKSRTDFAGAKQWAREKPQMLDRLISILIKASEKYLSAQIEAGAEVLQIFDSWAGLLSAADFARFVIGPTKQLVAGLKQKYPHIPIIGFPREAGEGYAAYIRETGVDCMSIDPFVSMQQARAWQQIKPLQGNLDPLLLVQGGTAMREGLEAILTQLGPRHIVNLGHGVVPQTPIDHVSELIRIVKAHHI